MVRQKILTLTGVLGALAAFLYMQVPSYAAQSSPAGEQVSQRHDTDAIIERKLKKMTPEQRAAAAVNAAEERLAADPAAEARASAIRTATAYAASVRAAALQDPKNSAKTLRAAAALEAAARNAAASAAVAAETKTLGGSNE